MLGECLSREACELADNFVKEHRHIAAIQHVFSISLSIAALCLSGGGSMYDRKGSQTRVPMMQRQ